MSAIRNPAVAGSFYPAEPERLRAMIQSFLAEVHPSGPPPKALIAPHAGFIYSGPVASHAYARLGLGRARIRRVVLLGPSHRVAFRGLAVPSALVFGTPLGEVPVDAAGVQTLLQLPFVRTYDPAHALEHSLEVHLPFLQEVLGTFTLVPVVVGDATLSEVAAALDLLWEDEGTVVVASSDLSHYLGYDDAKRADALTTEAILALAPERLGTDSACGRLPVGGMLLAARARGLKAEVLDTRNSGDTAGDRTRVVGYGAYAFVP